MSHSLARKFDKIVAKLGHKHKENKGNDNENNDNQDNPDDSNNDGSNESFLQRMKGHSHGKGEQNQSNEGIPPDHVIAEELKGTPFQGKEETKISFYVLMYRFVCDVSSEMKSIPLNYLKINAHL